MDSNLKYNFKKIKELGIHKYIDVLYFFPKKISFLKIITFNDDLKEGIFKGIVCSKISAFYKKNLSFVRFKFNSNNFIIDIIAFNQVYLKNVLNNGSSIYISAKKNKGNWIANKVYYNNKNFDELKQTSFYELNDLITQNAFKEIVKLSLSKIEINNFLPTNIHDKYKLISRKQAFYYAHFPKNSYEHDKSIEYFKYEEAFIFYLDIISGKKQLNNTFKNYSIKKLNFNFINDILDKLPFKLTNSQINCINVAYKYLNESNYINNDILIQGDVGCGKTIVAIILLYLYAKSNYQCVFLAPTTILALQHFDNVINILKDLGIKVAILTSNNKKKNRDEIIQDLKLGSIDIIVGTHSLLNTNINFLNLGLVIVDEQQRFGVKQRELLRSRNNIADIIYMTATPIPRTLAISMFSNLKLINITDHPFSKKSIDTQIVDKNQWDVIIESIKQTINKKEQVYFVCPLITSGKTKLTDIEFMENKLITILDKRVKIGVLHGKQHENIKNKIIEAFKDGFIDILLSTTVIEVGVHVDNATLMIIYDAQQFGLSQLHQLRGRIGRSSKESKCLLVCYYKNNRLKYLQKSNDGFYLAKKDLELRGPGDFLGEKQSGLPVFRFITLPKDIRILKNSKKDILSIIKDIKNKDNERIFIYLEKKKQSIRLVN